MTIEHPHPNPASSELISNSAENAASQETRTTRWCDGLMLLFTLLYGGVCYWQFDQIFVPLTGDSLTYWDVGKSFAQGHGFVHRHTGTESPLTLWPPGVSVVCGALWKLGFESFVAGVWMTRVFWLGSVVVAFFLFRGFVRQGFAGAAVFLTMTSPGTLFVSAVLNSDTPCLCATLWSMLLLRLAAQRHYDLRWVAASGFVAGIGYSFRFAELAWLAAGCSALLLLGAVKMMSWRKALTLCLVWGSAALPIFLAIKLRNVFVLGKWEPYNVVIPSTIGPFENLRWCISAIFSDGISYADLARDYLVRANPLIFGAVCLGVLSATLGMALLVLKRSQQSDQALTASMFAALILWGITTLVAARSKYEWINEMITFRHTGQFDFCLIALLLGGLKYWRGTWKTLGTWTALAVVAAMILMRVAYLDHRILKVPTPNYLACNDSEFKQALLNLPPKSVIFCTTMVINLYVDRPIRRIYGDTGLKSYDATLSPIPAQFPDQEIYIAYIHPPTETVSTEFVSEKYRLTLHKSFPAVAIYRMIFP